MSEGANTAPGRGLLKVTGILMVIFGSISILLALFSTLLVGIVGGALGSLGGDAALGAGVAAGGALAIIFAFLPGIFQFIVGIVGIKNCNKPEKAGVCQVYAIILIALVIIGAIINTFDFSVVIGLVLPVLYLIGALKNKQAA